MEQVCYARIIHYAARRNERNAGGFIRYIGNHPSPLLHSAMSAGFFDKIGQCH